MGLIVPTKLIYRTYFSDDGPENISVYEDLDSLWALAVTSTLEEWDVIVQDWHWE